MAGDTLAQLSFPTRTIRVLSGFAAVRQQILHVPASGSSGSFFRGARKSEQSIVVPPVIA